MKRRMLVFFMVLVATILIGVGGFLLIPRLPSTSPEKKSDTVYVREIKDTEYYRKEADGSLLNISEKVQEIHSFEDVSISDVQVSLQRGAAHTIIRYKITNQGTIEYTNPLVDFQLLFKDGHTHYISDAVSKALSPGATVEHEFSVDYNIIDMEDYSFSISDISGVISGRE